MKNNRIIKRQLKKAGYNFNDPKQATFKIIDRLIKRITINHVSNEEMIKFLELKIKELKK